MPEASHPVEFEVPRLLAAGRSNAQIADDLVISQNTVIRHVSNIYAKTGAAKPRRGHVIRAQAWHRLMDARDPCGS